MDVALRNILLLSWMTLIIMDPAASLHSTHKNEEEPDLLDPQWSVWSDWSPCSRTCDGGATYQTRLCLDKIRGCSGRDIRYQICNMQPCPELVDFRWQQCSNYNSIPYQGKLHVWVPHADPKSPCALWCRSLNTTGPALVVQLAARVHDGTRCKPGSLDMCIDGICQPVGCDLQLNSELKIDACGVCGGDGSSCSDESLTVTTNTTSQPSHNNHHHHHHHHRHHHQEGGALHESVSPALTSASPAVAGDYQWEAGQPLSPCSASCDGGEQEVEWICRNRANGAEISSALCEEMSGPRPTAKFVRCNTDIPCPPKWVVEPWGWCSVTCGGGVKERRVYCQQGRNSSKVDDVICTTLIGHKVRTHEPCNTHECPQWFEGPWSECTTTCGNEGVQTRTVVCRDARGHVTDACPEHSRPAGSRPCPSMAERPDCPTTTQAPITSTAPNRAPRQKVTPFSLFDDDEEEDEQNKEEELKGVLVRQTGLAGINSVPSSLLAEKLQVGEINLVPTDPTLGLYYACGWFYKSFIAGEWSPCSVTCGDGTREREVHCKIFLEFSKTIATLPDKECPGPKPVEMEPCFMRPCSLSNKYEPWVGQFSDQSNYHKLMLGVPTRRPGAALEDLRAATKMELTSQAGGGHVGSSQLLVTKPAATSSTYIWKTSGFSQCSASCLGGVQESIIECVRESDGQRVSPQLCPMDRGRPDSITRTCNDVPCPPRWNTSDFSACTRSCGGGIQTREVHCIHEVARGGGNTLPVGAELCPQPPPRAQQFCNMIDCPVEWKTGEWSQCSSTCEGGYRVRKVTCQQILALGQVLTKTANQCNPTTKPAESKPCNTGKICSSSTETISTSSTTAEPATAPPDLNPVEEGQENNNDAHSLPKILSVNQTFVQQNLMKKKVTLKIGGLATVYKGTHVKIRCPVKHFDKSKIAWMKDHTYLVKSQKYELNKKGMLRIKDVTYSDSGVYSCIAGRIAANISLTVRPTTGHNSLEPDLQWETFNTPNAVDGNGRGVNDTLSGRMKGNGNKDRNRSDAGSKEPSSAAGTPWPGNLEDEDDYEEEAEEEEEEEDELKEIKGNSLLTGSKSYPEQPTVVKHPTLTSTRNRPVEVWTEDTFGQIYSDQEQEWARQMPHYTYVTRPRTIRPPPPPTTSPTTPITSSKWTTTTTPSTTPHRYDDDDDDAYPDNGLIHTKPEVIDPVPTLWPTSNWWGSIDPLRNNHKNNRNSRLDSTSSSSSSSSNSGSGISRSNSNAYYPAIRSGSSRVHPSPTSSSSSSPPYFQLLLAGLLQQKESDAGGQLPAKKATTSKKVRKSSTAAGHHRRAKQKSASDAAQQVVKPIRRSSKAGKKKEKPSAATIPFGDDVNRDANSGDSPVILGKGKAEQLKFEWLLTPWSKCSQTCGGSGFQVRAAQCIVRLNNVTKSVEAALCEDAGLTVEDGGSSSGRQPATVQKCGLEACPKWQAGSWTPCHQSRCFTWNTALQKRPLDCVMSNGTVLDPLLCNERDKPTQKRECFNENCRGTWKVSEWSHCSATCDSNGHQSRILHCVWNGTDLPAGLACADLPRLPVTRPCRGPKCPKRGQCRNQSEYCDLVQTLDLCYVPRYREHCCHTCQKQEQRRRKSVTKRRKKTHHPISHVATNTTSSSSSYK